MNRKFLFKVILLSSIYAVIRVCCYAQDVKPISDTLRAITVLADTVKGRSAGLVKIDARSTRRMVTALGDGDVIKRMNYN